MRIAMNSSTAAPTPAEVVFFNGKIATQDDKRSFADALAVANGRIIAAGPRDAVMRHAIDSTQHVDLKGRTVIPGLNDSHLHVIRGGLNFNMELRWDGVPSLADALDMLRKQVARTPAPQWVRVVGGWNEFQFAERRGPTLEEINAIAPDTPVFILHLYDSALLNAAALRAVGYTKDTPESAGRRDPARQARQSDRHADRAAERRASVRDARQRPEARAGRPAQFDAAFHARTEPPRRDERDRRGRRLPGLSG